MARQGSTQQRCLEPPCSKTLEMAEPRKSCECSGWHRAVAVLAVNQERSWIHALTHRPSQPTAWNDFTVG